jgi:hypothetical protein
LGEVGVYMHASASVSLPYVQEIGSPTVRTCAASQPVLTRYKLL